MASGGYQNSLLRASLMSPVNTQKLSQPTRSYVFNRQLDHACMLSAWYWLNKDMIEQQQQ